MTAPSGTILIIDGDPTRPATLSPLLEQLGYTVVVASSGREALDRSATQRFSLIFLSIALWGMNSYQVLERLNEMGILRTTPVSA